MKGAIVTGGAGGIGSAICTALARSGYFVGVFDRDILAAETVAERLNSAMAVQVDITDETSVAAALRRFDAVPELLVNNAGIAATSRLQQNAATFMDILTVNVIGTYIMTRAVIEGMMARRSGCVINITSVAAFCVNPSNGAYGPSKAALANLSKAMALEYAPYGIRINCVAPGMISDGMGVAAASDPRIRERRVGKVPAGRLGSGDDIAETVAFLASDNASYLRGHEIVIDGALTLTALVGAMS